MLIGEVVTKFYGGERQAEAVLGSFTMSLFWPPLRYSEWECKESAMRTQPTNRTRCFWQMFAPHPLGHVDGMCGEGQSCFHPKHNLGAQEGRHLD